MKTVLITGIGRGIGKALAEKFLAEDWTVIGTVYTSAEAVKHENLTTYQLDLSSPESIAKCADAITDSGAKIDILINNAAAMLDADDIHLDVDRLRKTLEINVVGIVDFTEKILPVIDNGGHILNTSSQAGSLAEADILADTHEPYHYPAYKISKTAINMYTRTLAVRMTHENTGIIVSSINPGWVKTDMGGSDAPITPGEAAADIFKLAISCPETGQFWYKGKKYPW
ncbi:MAG: SDR family NAD(P)-dependent oxidoreductase [Patescibacteria group bacterium]|nr:SDR family NAD(P)-dependent oxidoreductase [Patescibacteria group bacterium]